MILVSDLANVKVRVRVAKLHTDQTVGSSVMNARVVTVSQVAGFCVGWVCCCFLFVGFVGCCFSWFRNLARNSLFTSAR